jgi:TPR repeat protein
LSLDDGLELDADKISKAKNNDGEALVDIGFTYKSKQQDDSKAMAWYQLAINQNNSTAYNNLGFMYEYGYGVSQDHVTAMEYYLQAAKLNHRVAIFNIAILFLTGVDVPINKYKALEWFAKSGREADDVKKLNKQGIHLTEEDKSKPFYEFKLCY